MNHDRIAIEDTHRVLDMQSEFTNLTVVLNVPTFYKHGSNRP